VISKDEPFSVYIGYDDREAVASRVCAFSMRRSASISTVTRFLKHRALRAAGLFDRPWRTDGKTGQLFDVRDGKPFSTEFAFTRFLVPQLQKHKGWALFCDADMLWRADIAELVELLDDRYALMCVQHEFHPAATTKMDGQPQARYWRKNWSSLMAFNCGHPAHAKLSVEVVNKWPGAWLHALAWLKNEDIGALPPEWNFLVGHTQLPTGVRPKVLHFTDGGPWFDGHKDVPYGGLWNTEYAHLLRMEGGYDSTV
jgi:lipopolysaccharide biosynthesis glycosyltransferase